MRVSLDIVEDNRTVTLQIIEYGNFYVNANPSELISDDPDQIIELDADGKLLVKSSNQGDGNDGNAGYKGEFTGELDFSNINGTYYDDYDLSNGTIIFTTNGNKILSSVYFRVISDGITPFTTESNLENVFNEWYNVPDDRILPIGTHSFFILKTPTGIALSIPENSFAITPPDVTKPVITLLGDNPISLIVGVTYTEQGATAQDDKDGDITSDIVITGNVDTATAGTYTKFYNVQDAAGNSAVEKTRSIVIVDLVFDPVQLSPVLDSRTQVTYNGTNFTNTGFDISPLLKDDFTFFTTLNKQNNLNTYVDMIGQSLTNQSLFKIAEGPIGEPIDGNRGVKIILQGDSGNKISSISYPKVVKDSVTKVKLKYTFSTRTINVTINDVELEDFEFDVINNFGTGLPLYIGAGNNDGVASNFAKYIIKNTIIIGRHLTPIESTKMSNWVNNN